MKLVYNNVVYKLCNIEFASLADISPTYRRSVSRHHRRSAEVIVSFIRLRRSEENIVFHCPRSSRSATAVSQQRSIDSSHRSTERVEYSPNLTFAPALFGDSERQIAPAISARRSGALSIRARMENGQLAIVHDESSNNEPLASTTDAAQWERKICMRHKVTGMEFHRRGALRESYLPLMVMRSR